MLELSDPNQYTVGWICALETEYTAAELFLDETHARPLVTSPNDPNHYTCGTIAGHNVVMAVLPDGEYGVGSAASVVTNMLHSFPNVRIGLMVGIGGGAPTSKNDIRLGDVVVSSPRDGRGGVYQYDVGKTIQGLGFVQTGFLDQPSTTVRSALSGLKKKHRRRGHQFKETIELILNDEPMLKNDGFSRPAPETDCLFASNFSHPQHDTSDCEDVCAVRPSSIVPRKVRGEHVKDPMIHYGLIASGNQLMKDAEVRDRLANEKDILCFEMEAAGIMNRFPCMVIRGICDYSDSHKNKAWQGYAALTAAAYAKDLLNEILPQRVEAEKKLALAIELLSSDIRTIAASIDHMKVSERSTEIMTWLDAPDPSINHRNALEKHHLGTGQWFLESHKFLQWKQESRSFLWLHGLSGCGKTVLSSTIIEHSMEEDPSRTFYFYFDFSHQGKQRLDSMIRSLLDQFYHRSKEAKKAIDLLYESNNRGRQQPGNIQMMNALASVIKQSDCTTVILDALDESQSSTDIVRWCKDILESGTSKVRLLITSRTEVVDWPDEKQIFSVQSNEVSADISFYVQWRLRGIDFSHWNKQSALRDDVEETLVQKADGMFQWATLQLDALKQCHSRSAINKALANLPRTLNATYTRMLTLIHAGPHVEQVIIILQILVWSGGILPLGACIDAIAVCPEKAHGFDVRDRLFDPSRLVNICLGLVTMRNYDGYSQEYLILSHASVQDYLSSVELFRPFRHHLCEEVARLSVLRICLAYLGCVDWSILDGAQSGDKECFDRCDHDYLTLPARSKTLLTRFPFAPWAQKFWTEHAKALESTSEDARSLVLAFLQSPATRLKPAILFNVLSFDGVDSNQQYPLYLAACIGLSVACRQLIELDYTSDLSRPSNDTSEIAYNAKDHDLKSQIGPCLMVASLGGHVEVVRELLRCGADPNFTAALEFDEQGVRTGTALCFAASNGHDSVVRLLIESGASANHSRTMSSEEAAFNAACFGGHDKAVEFVLAR